MLLFIDWWFKMVWIWINTISYIKEKPYMINLQFLEIGMAKMACRVSRICVCVWGGGDVGLCMYVRKFPEGFFCVFSLATKNVKKISQNNSFLWVPFWNNIFLCKRIQEQTVNPLPPWCLASNCWFPPPLWFNTSCY